MSDVKDALRRLEILKADIEQQAKDLESGTRRMHVDKKTHRIRFEKETEEDVTIVIEKKDDDK
ncbi:MAG: hypothetical protein H7Z38_08035 [Rubrivivax sp.]|nr:hypothetical protein [Pyrinomonadaceae bacterium]